MTQHATVWNSEDASERILLVDDNPTNLQVLAKMLDGHGYDLLVAKSGETALTVARETRPLLVLLEIMMPGMDGFEVCKRLKEKDASPDAAVIFLSALGDTKSKVRGLQLGAVDYLTKPFQVEEVIARVETHLTIRRLQRELLQRNQQLAALNARTTRELQAAANLQHALLPHSAAETKHARFAWAYRACDELAGDALNVFALDERYIGMFVLDVSGHGVVASLLSVALTHALTPRLDSSSLVTRPDAAGLSFVVPPAEVAGRLNRMFPMQGGAAQFATLLYGVLDTESGLFRYTAAGHPGPIVAAPDRVFAAGSSQGLPIGIDEGTIYEEACIHLDQETRITLFTDGLIERTSPLGELFGTERLVGVIDELSNAPIGEFVDEIEQRILAWGGANRLGDDLSILAFECRI